MSREKPQAVEGLVTSDAVLASARLRKRALVGLICLVALVIIGAGGWYVWTYTSLFRKPVPAKTAVDYSKLQPAEAVKAAQQELKDATTTEEKVTAYNNLGQAYMRNNQPSQAVGAYEQAVSQSGSSTSGGSISDVPTLSQLAYAYVAAGDKASAIKTLEQIIAIEKASNEPQKDRIISRYEADLSYLQGPPKQ